MIRDRCGPARRQIRILPKLLELPASATSERAGTGGFVLVHGSIYAMLASSEAPRLLPIMRYRDLGSAVDWLSEAFGFEKQVAVNDADGAVFYAQMSYGGSMIMLGAVRETDLDKLMRQPDEVGGVETQSCYLVVDDVDEHYARAKAAGAEIVLEIRSDALGRRGYSCRDPQGHIWNFGTYNPWKGKFSETDQAPRDNASWWRRPRYAAVLALIALVAAGAAIWTVSGPSSHGISSDGRTGTSAEEAAKNALARERVLKEMAERAVESARRELAQERSAREAAERTVQSQRAEAERVRTAKEPAASPSGPAAEELARERKAKEAAEGNVKALESQLAAERRAREEALRSLAAARGDLAKARAAKESLERAVQEARKQAELSKSQPSSIETSATEAGPERKQSTWTLASRSDPAYAGAPDPVFRPTARKARARAALEPRLERYPPTYITGLREVPWPYNVWYRK